MAKIPDEVLNELMKNYKSPEDLLGEDGLLKQLSQALLEKALEGEMTHHLGYEKNSAEGKNTGNSRNGKYKKSVKSKSGILQLDIPRDRNSEFEPQIIRKHQTRFDGFDDKILSMYSRGMTTRDIKAHLKDIYGIEVSADFISIVTSSVLDTVKEWQNRPLDPVYPIVYLDALSVKARDEGHIINKSVYLAIGINMQGLKEVLGMWIEKTEGAKFWLKVVTELNNRGVEDIFIAAVDGLKGFPDAINAVFPKTQVQLCLVHMVRNSLRFVPYKDRRAVAKDLKEIYRAATIELAEKALENFSKKWDDSYSMISKSWKEHWLQIIPLFDYDKNIRKIIYTTNAIESLNMTLRKVIKNRAAFPNDEAVEKLLYLALQNISQKWTQVIRDWGKAINQFTILYGDRVPI